MTGAYVRCGSLNSMNTTTGNTSAAAHEAWREHAREAHAAHTTERLGEVTAAEDIAAKARARQARLDANVKLRAAELALQRAYRSHRDTARQLAAVNAADEAYQAACRELEKYEPRPRDPFACLPGGGF